MTTILCNICKAAETKTVNVNGTPTLVTNFNVAENYYGRDKQRHTQFYRVALWRNGANLEKYLTLGRPLLLSGRVKPSAYIDSNGVAQAQLEISNPQITFATANPTNEVDGVVEGPADLPFVTEEE